MKKSSKLSWLKFTALLHIALCISLLLFASACGDADKSSSNTESSESGSISFSVEWIGAPTIENNVDFTVTRFLNCSTSGVSVIEATVYDQYYNWLTSGGPWNCAAHSGTINNVPEGFNYIVELIGKNSSGNIIYMGEKTGINVYTGETAYAGTIIISPYSSQPDLGMTFKLIPAGTFMMGSPSYEPGRDDDETQHQVTFTQAFYMQTTEVTQDQWVAVMGSNPSDFSGCSDCPVEQVSWNDIQTFITNLNTRGEGTYRLPTEAEWEYAARAGSTTEFANGDITYYADMIECEYDPNLDAMGWYCYNSSSTQSVGQKNPNAWGLYDMHGNVYEWCQDWYGAYPSYSVTDPTGPLSGSDRVFRGAGWWNYARYCRSAYRGSSPPGDIGNVLGFRLVKNP